MTGHTPAQKERLVLIMKKTYKIEVDCANCAQKMEDAANTVSGVEKATVSLHSGNDGENRSAFAG